MVAREGREEPREFGFLWKRVTRQELKDYSQPGIT